MKRIDNIFIDYGNGTLLINGRKVDAPVRVIIKEQDGWDVAKLFNSESAKPEMTYPEIVIDARNFFDDLSEQRMKEFLRGLLEELLPEKVKA